MSRQKDINDFLDTELNTGTTIPFKLYYRYHLGGTSFDELMFKSIDLGEEDPNNVKVQYEGLVHNTQNGQFTLENIKYIPCIIEDFVANFEPIDIFTDITYSIPMSFFVSELLNADNGDIFNVQIEAFQNRIRGEVFDLSGFRALFSHTDVRPVSGLVDVNGKWFRMYQTTIDIQMISTGYFGKEIVVHVQNDNVFSGATTRVYPLIQTSNRANELAPFQGFKTVANDNAELGYIPDLSGFGLGLSFLVNGDSLTDYLTKQRFEQPDESVWNISITYPNLVGNPFSDVYLIENISGAEGLTDKLITTVEFKRADDKVSG
jgi:hypothetical protein